MDTADTTPWVAARDAVAELESDRGRWATIFVGRRWPFFWLVLGTGALSVLTLGIYRFWQKTRIRRWMWSAIRPGGHPLEYVGDPFEKLLGFLIAVVILAFYIGIVNLCLMFASFALFQGNAAAYFLSFIGVFPIWYYARYRARRYILARTRWMGLRFGLAPGAWGYALRALWHGFLTVITLGLLWPRMTFKLEKYRTDRMFYGDVRFEQGGKWTMLFGALKWHFVTLGLGVVALILSVSLPGAAPFAWGLAGLIALYAMAYYRVETLKRLTATKRAGHLGLRLTARPLRVLWIALSGYTLAALVASLPTVVLLGIFLELQSLETLVELGAETLPPVFAQLDRWALIALSVMCYFAIFLFWSALTRAWVTLPIARHYAGGLEISGIAALPHIHQRPRDESTQAEGFAEALDVGASL